ncbi:MAG: hypothetical protein H0V82_05485 [Candidatus Protochlamydia sp.]|nr:hypothetical protein [Candidatus Protochlamydia sp.]
MVNLCILEDLIQNANPQSPSENVVDEHFDQIVSCIEQEKTKEAAKLIEKVFSKNVPDIRLIIYYLYADFAENGIKSLNQTFPLIKSLVNEHIEILTPRNRVDKHVQSSLNWLFSHLLHRFKYFEKLHSSGKAHPLWKKSTSEISLDEVDQLIEITREFNRCFLEKWPLSPTKERILHLIKKIEDIRHMIAEQQPSIEENSEIIEEEVTEINELLPAGSEVEEVKHMAEQFESSDIVFIDFNEEEPDSHSFIDSVPEKFISYQENEIPVETPEKVVEEIEEEIIHSLPEMESPLPQAFSSSAKEDQDTLSNSLNLFIQSLDDLSRKLKIFEALIEKNDYLKAAVVANDIDHLIENFDPLSYFPKLFAKYFSIFAKHVTALTEQYEKKDSLQVKALVRLYRTDLKMFLDW